MFRIIVIAGMAVTVAAALGHLAVFGPKRVRKGARTVRRFSLWERFIHVMTVVGFLGLVGTGLYAVIVQGGPLHGWLWVLHMAAAPLFAAGLALLLMTWARDAQFAPADWEWVKRFGGYLWGDKHAPAERFNFGQKTYLWVVSLIGLASLVSGLARINPLFDAGVQDFLYQVHRYSALLFVMGGIVHLYLGTICNPGTFGAMLTGKVTPEWAAGHHPLWWENLREGIKSEKKKPKK